MGKLIIASSKSCDASVCGIIATVVAKLNNREVEVVQFEDPAGLTQFLESCPFEADDALYLLDIMPDAEAINIINGLNIWRKQMYTKTYVGYIPWSGESAITACKLFIYDPAIENMLASVPAQTHEKLNSLVQSVSIDGTGPKWLGDAMKSGTDFIDIVANDIIEGADPSETIFKQPRYIHFTHSDLDAAGCVVLLDVAHKLGGHKYEHRFCKNPSDCAEKIKAFLSELDDSIEYNVVISDISIKDEEIADALDAAFKSGKIATLHLFDHHPTAQWMDKYPWCRIILSDTDEDTGEVTKTCGTLLLYDCFYSVVANMVTRPLIDLLVGAYVEIVRLYDTYDWKGCGSYGKIAYDHNTIFCNYGMEKYTKYIAEQLAAGNDVRYFTDEQKEIIAAEDAKFEAHLEECRKRLFVRSGVSNEAGNFDYGVLFCSKYTSETGNRLSEEHPELSFIMMINIDRMKVEIRTARDDFDTSEFAKLCGGGGHPKASGFPLNYDDIQNITMKVCDRVNAKIYVNKLTGMYCKEASEQEKSEFANQAMKSMS